MTLTIGKTGKYPKLGDASFDQECFDFILLVKTGIILCPVDHIGKSFEMVIEGDEFFDQLVSLIFNAHQKYLSSCRKRR